MSKPNVRKNVCFVCDKETKEPHVHDVRVVDEDGCEHKLKSVTVSPINIFTGTIK